MKELSQTKRAIELREIRDYRAKNSLCRECGSHTNKIICQNCLDRKAVARKKLREKKHGPIVKPPGERFAKKSKDELELYEVPAGPVHPPTTSAWGNHKSKIITEDLPQ